MNSILNVDQISVAIEKTQIINNISFSVLEGEIGCLLGPSGCGKTTLLRSIVGFLKPNAGSITINGCLVASKSVMQRPEQRNIGMVFQDLALFPHLTVKDNIAFGMRAFTKSDIRARIDELLHLVELAGVKKKFPHQLSGGQQQRIALARAIAPKPDILLLDEPFSGQDTERRVQLAHEVRKLLKQSNTTAILVTHDQKEAFAISDKIGVIEGGELRQWDSAYNIYHNPADKFVADFIGEGVFICGSILDKNTLQTELGEIKGNIPDIDPGELVDLLVRPDDIIHDDESEIKGILVETNFRGANHMYKIRMPGSTHVLCLVPSHHNHKVGEHVGVRIQPEHLVVYPRQFD